ncbi:hypothetical protein BH11ARM1_BH11ARM1_16550 [soil metagenome]
MANPIADLSYRNYDGPLEPPAYRWWAIAKASMQLSLKKKILWFLGVASGYWYLIMLAVFYFVDTLGRGQTPLGGKNPLFDRIIWKDQFLNAFSISQFMLFLVALIIGVGAIANDNRANALLVYLSKPVSRMDYLIGKWLGIFIPIFVATAVPMLAFYGYCFLSYRENGFLTEDPHMIFHLLILCFVPAVFHANVSLGISSLFQQGRLAGATYAGIFFMTLFFTKAMQVVWIINSGDGKTPIPMVGTLYYCSVDGLQIGLAKIILGTVGSGLFAGIGDPNAGVGQARSLPIPSVAPFVTAYFLICGLSLLIAWWKVRAVEVVA